MPIIGFNFDKIQVEKLKNPSGKIEIKNNLGIKDVELEKIQLEGVNEVIKFIFEFSLIYEPEIGNIIINGHLLYSDEQKKMKEIVKDWKKEKKMQPQLLKNLLNNVMQRCHVKSLVLAQEVNLPTHITLPTIMEVKPDQTYIG